MISGVMMTLMVCLGGQEPPYRGPAARGGPPVRGADWQVESRVRTRLQFDDNVFRLDDALADRLDQDRASDAASGRFDDMDSAWDLIIRPEARFRINGPSPLGNKLELWIDLDFDQYVLNPSRSHLDFELGAEQRIGADGWIALEFGFVPDYFSRNYLADAVDPAGDGVSAAERIYAEGVSRRWDVTLSYRHRIIDRTRAQPLGLDVIVSAGYRDRAYDGPFEVRDRQAPFLGTTVRIAHNLRSAQGFKAVKGGVRYRYEDADSPGGAEVLLLDEPDFGQDLNGDGDATDPNARTVQAVDRSYTAHEVGLYLEVEFSAGWDVGVEYARRFRDYSSSEPFDVSHRNREDARDEIEVYARMEISKAWDGRIGFGWQRQRTDRPSDPGGAGEELDYERNVVTVSLGYSW